MARDTVDMTPIESRDELVAWIEKGVKPKERFRVGTEHEKFGFYRDTHAPVPYEGPRGIEALLKGMEGLLGWEPIEDDGKIIGLADVTGGGAISLEPGGQFELSGAPLDTIHQTCAEAHAHFAQVREIAEPLGIGFLGLGMSPKWSRAETPVMPKSRYQIMTRYMPKVGTLGLDMMYRTSTVQANLDFSSEADMVKKLRVSLAWQPVATAIFANSPFTEGKLNGYLSFRSAVWMDTDNQRAGMLPFAFEDGMGFERYVDYALDVPMYFIKRGDTYVDVAGSSFRDLLAGKNPAAPGERAVLSDWVNHVGTIFPEVRLKRYLEMRGADSGRCRASWRSRPLRRPALRRRRAGCGLRPRQGLDGGGTAEAARRRAEARLQGGDPRHHRARARPADAHPRPDGPAPPRPARHERLRRDTLSRPHPGHRRRGPHGGRGADREISGAVAGPDRPGF